MVPLYLNGSTALPFTMRFIKSSNSEAELDLFAHRSPTTVLLYMTTNLKQKWPTS
jgi:hypothetical protein